MSLDQIVKSEIRVLIPKLRRASYELLVGQKADIFSAHDQALARSGKSITASDVLKAVTEMDFGPADELLPLLEAELAGERAECVV